jgi:hypothetical protein
MQPINHPSPIIAHHLINNAMHTYLQLRAQVVADRFDFNLPATNARDVSAGSMRSISPST